MDDDDRVLAYVQDKLDDDARAAFEKEMDTRPQIRAEVSALLATRAAMASEETDSAERDAGWERLSQSIEAQRAPANLNRRPMLMQMAAVAIGAIAIWQFLAVPNLPGSNEGAFAPVSEAPAELTLRVVFSQSASVAELSELLTVLGARIVDGPSAVGLFTLEFDNPEARDTAADTLAARNDLVEVVTRP